MNTPIAILDQHEIDPSVAVGDRNTYITRVAVRAVLRDADGQIALMYSNRHDYYKLPGGGVDEGEDLLTALHRELLEEVGAASVVINETLGSVIEWRDYTKFTQTSFAYSAITKGDLVLPQLTESEKEEGFEVRWVNGIEQAIKLVAANSLVDNVAISFMSKRDSAILRAVATS